MEDKSKRDEDKPTATAKATTKFDDDEDVIRLDLRQAADFMGITPQRLNRLRQRREIPARRDGLFRWSFRQPDLMAYVEKGAGIDTAGTATPASQDVASVPTPILHASSLEEIQQIMVELGPPETESLNSARAHIEQSPLVRLVNAIMVTGINQGASDIHIEPDRRNLRVRIRIDGVMQQLMTMPKHIQDSVIMRYKVMAEMAVYKPKEPQRGCIRINHGENSYNLRVSSVPTMYGENLVLHVLNASGALTGLNKLGFDPTPQVALETILVAQSGLLLIAGPPNSGLTTTAGAIIHKLNNVELHICSWEEVLEYTIPGIMQSYKKGTKETSTAEGVQALLRHDPNVLFLGDINDQESAQAAVDAALSGVLTIATIPALDGVDALRRLVAFGVDRTLVSRALAGVCAQRLVRRVCPHCKVAEEHPIGVLASFGFFPLDRNEQRVPLYRGEGCDVCRNKGYKGRVGLFEVLLFHWEVAELLRRNAPDGDLRDAARAAGLIPMREDGLKKILGGYTTVDEVTRALHRVP